ncbi:proline/glycine betaine ABC transporter permease, partial [Borreliella americana]|nr:proline/glycine betaine ABC transporter permease [Borreliella americana]
MNKDFFILKIDNFFDFLVDNFSISEGVGFSKSIIFLYE